MSSEDLQDLLGKLRQEIKLIEQAEGEAHERLAELIAELETRIEEQPGEETDNGSTQTINTFIEQFEVEHPRITGILNEIMVTLSNMGI